MKVIIKYFIQGVLLLAPLLITVFVLTKLFWLLDELIPKELIIWSVNDKEILVGDIPGLGLLLLISILILIGFIGSTFVTDPIVKRFNKLLAKIPLLKIIYDSIKDLLSAFVGNKKKFTHPVMIKEHSTATVYRLGFVTQSDVSEITNEKGLSAVYLPHSYAFSGVVVFVENQYIKPLNIKSSEAMKFIVSGGVINSQELTEENNL